MSEEVESLDLDDVMVMSARLPNGIYEVKLIDLQASADRSSGKPSLKPTFEVTSGEQKGMTYTGRYGLGTYTTKAGKKGSFGVSNIKRDAVELGVLNKLPNPFPLDANKAKLAYHKAFKGLKMKLRLSDGQPSKTDGKVYTEFQLLAGTTNAPEGDEAEEEIVF